MADEVDLSNDFYEKLHDYNLASIRAKAASIPAGIEGECESCGLHSKRLVDSMCAPCRDDLERLESANK